MKTSGDAKDAAPAPGKPQKPRKRARGPSQKVLERELQHHLDEMAGIREAVPPPELLDEAAHAVAQARRELAALREAVQRRLLARLAGRRPRVAANGLPEAVVGDWQEWHGQMRRELSAAAIDDAPGKLDYVATYLMGCTPAMLPVALAVAPPAGEFLDALRELMVARLREGAPAQYVGNRAYFLDLTLVADPRALIPRPETEEWTDALIRHLSGQPQLAPSYRAVEPRPRTEGRAFRIHDVCTGSGCVALALAQAFPAAVVSASDLSADALAQAEENARRNGLRVAFRQANLLDGLPDASLDVLTANPPYISRKDYARLDPTVRDFEPRRALVGGTSGLELISRLAAEAPRVLKSGAEFWMEIGDDQGPATEKSLCQTDQYSQIQILSDFGGRARLARAIRR